jgi:hypothetical protein
MSKNEYTQVAQEIASIALYHIRYAIDANNKVERPVTFCPYHDSYAA